MTTATIPDPTTTDTTGPTVTPAPSQPLVSLFDSPSTTPEGDQPSPNVEPGASAVTDKATAPAKAEPPVTGATPVTPATDTVKKGAEPDKPVTDWEARYRDTANYATRVNQQNIALAHQLEIINKKLDGTYDPDQDKAPEPSADELVSHAKLEGKIAASQAMAETQYGKDAFQKLVLDENSPYARLEASDPTIWPRVMASPAPMLEAMTVLKEHIFFSQYGRDPDAIKQAIRKEVLETEREKIRADVTKDVMARIAQKNEQIVGVGDLRGTTGASTHPIQPSGSIVKRIFD